MNALLRYRTVLERQQRLCLERANAVVEGEIEKLRELERAKDEVGQARLRSLQSGMRAAELMILSTDALEAAVGIQRAEIDRVRGEQERARSAYTVRRREKETVERALERQQAELSKEMERRAQATMDDATLQRCARSGRNSL